MRINKIEIGRKREMEQWKLERSLNSIRRTIYKKSTTRISYLIILISLFLFIIYPVGAVVDLDNWEIFKKEIQECGTECWRTSDECACPHKEYKGSRVLLNINSPNSKTVGYLDINGTFEITDSRRVVDVTFTSVAKSKKNILVTGTSLINMPIEPGTGISWKINSEENTEAKTISLGIYESAQIYSSVFKFYTSDRKIKTAQQFECINDCSSNCGCNKGTCTAKKYNHDRSWSCNPAWCWTWGSGCTCCYAYASLIDAKYIMGFWDIKYERTELILCLNYDHPKYTCFSINEGGSFRIDNFILKVSNVFGIDRKLPKNVASIHKKRNRSFDLKNPDNIILDPDTRSLNSVAHGDIGDLSFFSIEDMRDNNQTKINMKWTGVNIERTCKTGNYPSCNYEGIIEDNIELFDTIEKVSDSIHTDFLTIACEHHPETNNLNLKVRPYKGAGQLQIALTVKNLELKRIDKQVIINSFKIQKCRGCRGCHTGFWCLIKISLKEPERFSLHLRSDEDFVVIETTNVIARNSITTYNITGFTSIKLENVKICIEETGDCAETIEILLDEPIRQLVLKNKLLISTTNKENIQDQDFFGSLLYGLTKFGMGIFDFFKLLFNNWYFLLLILISIALYLLIFHTRISRLLICFCPDFVLRYWNRREKYIKDVGKGFTNLKRQISRTSITAPDEDDSSSSSSTTSSEIITPSGAKLPKTPPLAEARRRAYYNLIDLSREVRGNQEDDD